MIKLATFWDIQREELIPALIGCTTFALIMIAYYLLKPVRESLFTHYVGANKLPHAYLVSVLVAYIAMRLYNLALRHIPKNYVIPGIIALLGCITGLFGLFSNLRYVSASQFASTFFLWISLVATVAPTVFWSTANDMFSVSVSRKIYGLIGLGGILGATAGSYLTQVLITGFQFSSESMIPFSVLFFFLAVPLFYWMQQLKTVSQQTEQKQTIQKEGLQVIFSNLYAGAMALLVMTMTFCGTILTVQYNQIVSTSLASKTDKTIFYASLYRNTNITAFFLQSIVTTAVLRLLGPIWGLIPLPCIGSWGTATLFFEPSLNSIALPWTCGLSLMYSLNQSSKELLYVPTGDEIKFAAKGYIDVMFFRLGDGLASLIMILLPSMLDAGSLPSVGTLAIAFVFWFGLLTILRRGYFHINATQP